MPTTKIKLTLEEYLNAWAAHAVTKRGVPIRIVDGILGVVLKNDKEHYHASMHSDVERRAVLVVTHELVELLRTDGHVVQAMLLFKAMVEVIRRLDMDMVKFALLMENNWDEAYNILCAEYLTEEENKLLNRVHRDGRRIKIVIDAIKGAVYGSIIAGVFALAYNLATKILH